MFTHHVVWLIILPINILLVRVITAETNGIYDALQYI
jgi:hypothetical protein